jgi:cytosine/adenosine deaminase-related metal-dependent hydrolase
MSLITVSKSFGMKTFGLSTSLLSSTTTSLSSVSSSPSSSLNKLRMMSSQGMKVLDLDVQKFGKILTENRAAFQVIDVREPHELDGII